MMFCPKCHSILKPEQRKSGKVLVCGCGYVNESNEGMTFREKVKPSTSKVEVVSEERSVLPKTKATCSSCGHETAFFWMVQTRAGDEPETKFLRCERCKHTWRDYS